MSTTKKKDTIQKKALQFWFQIHEVQFNHLGKFFLKISIQSSFSHDYSGITVQRQEKGDAKPGHEGSTDLIKQNKLNETVPVEDGTFIYNLPKGFCKNDTSHDVYLLVEAFDNSGKKKKSGKKTGEAKFAIYPRTNAPRVNINVQPGEDMYRTTDMMTMLRTLSMEEIEMHCGRIKYTARLREPGKEVDEPEPEEVPPPGRSLARTPDPPAPGPSKPPETPVPTPQPSPVVGSQIEIPRTPSPPGLDTSRKVAGSPLPGQAKRSDQPHVRWMHLSNPGKEEVVVLLHGAVQLPVLPTGDVPTPFTVITVEPSGQEGKICGSAASHATIHPTLSPMFEEMLTVEVEDTDVDDMVLNFMVADAGSKLMLTSYRLPVNYLVPFHQYHLEMVQPMKSNPAGVRLFATIMRRLSIYPWDLSCPNYLGLEVVLQGMKQELHGAHSPLVAVARIVPDYFNYKHDMLQKLPRPAGIAVTTVTFPSPHPGSFAVPPHYSQGHPQISLPGLPAQQPVWNNLYFFGNSRDNATLFTPGAALVIEYYPTSAAPSLMSWRVRNPAGFSTILLDQSVYRQLISPEGRMGLRVDDLPVQGDQLITTEEKSPTVGLLLRLLTTDDAASVPAPADPQLIPALDMTGFDITRDYYRGRPEVLPHFPDSRESQDQEEGPWTLGSPLRTPSPYAESLPSPDLRGAPPTPLPPRKKQLLNRIIKSPVIPLRDDELPPHDAMENVLPDYKYIFLDPNPRPAGAGEPRAGPSHQPEDVDRAGMNLLDHQMKELDRYRVAVHKMGQDILALRQQVRDLDAENSKLRRDLAAYSDTTRLLLETSDLDGLPKPEIIAKYVQLKRKLTSQTAEFKKYKERVVELQNELIKKNDREKEFLKISHAHSSQQELLQKFQDRAQKVKRLEEACRKQEKVIQKLEGMVANSKGSNKDNSGLIEENKRLRAEISDLRDQQRVLLNQPEDETEKLELYEKLEKTQGRVYSLERQLDENARQWSREKSDMLLRLQEAEHGFQRASPSFRDYPKIDTSKSLNHAGTDPRRFSKAQPGPRRYGSPRLDPLPYRS